MAVSSKLKMGMVGGGPGAFIGDVHRSAAQLDGQIEMVAGAFSSSPRKSKNMARVLSLEPRRVYRDYCEMIAKESQLPPVQRIDFVSIVTPNNFPINARYSSLVSSSSINLRQQSGNFRRLMTPCRLSAFLEWRIDFL